MSGARVTQGLIDVPSGDLPSYFLGMNTSYTVVTARAVRPWRQSAHSNAAPTGRKAPPQ